MTEFTDDRVQKVYDNLGAIQSLIDNALQYLETADSDISVYAVREEISDALYQIGGLLNELEE